METGYLAIGVVVLVIGLVIWIALHKNVIFTPAAELTRPYAALKPQRSRAKKAQPAAQPAAPAGETGPKLAELVSVGVSGVPMLESDAEMVSLLVIAKLIQADLVKQTPALEQVFNVKAGGGTRYKDVRAKLQEVLKEMGPGDGSG